MARQQEHVSMPLDSDSVKAAARQWQVAATGRPPAALDVYLRSHLVPVRDLPAELHISDTQQYYWHLPCNKHLCFQTIQACIRQVIAHDGQLRACLRCGSSYRLGAEPSRDRLTSYWVQVVWSSLEWALEQAEVQDAMQSRTWLLGAALAGRDRGYVVEAKVLKGRYGAADIYVPALDLIIQVDGEHHADPEQLKRDGRFNAAASAQQRRLLRLWHADVTAFATETWQAVQHCISSPEAMVRHSASHPIHSAQV